MAVSCCRTWETRRPKAREVRIDKKPPQRPQKLCLNFKMLSEKFHPLQPLNLTQLSGSSPTRGCLVKPCSKKLQSYWSTGHKLKSPLGNEMLIVVFELVMCITVNLTATCVPVWKSYIELKAVDMSPYRKTSRNYMYCFYLTFYFLILFLFMFP